MTGTPLENHLGELWAHFDFLMPGFLGDLRSFNARWRKPIEENGETLRAQLLALGIEPLSSTPEAFAAHLKSETEKWARVIKAAGIKPE